MAFSDSTENEVLAALTGQGPFEVDTPHLSLHSEDPGESSGAGEASGGGYARVDALGDFDPPVDGEVATNTAVTWTDLPAGSWTHVGLWDAASGGAYKARAALPEPVTLPAGSSFTVPAGGLTFTLD